MASRSARATGRSGSEAISSRSSNVPNRAVVNLPLLVGHERPSRVTSCDGYRRHSATFQSSLSQAFMRTPCRVLACAETSPRSTRKISK